MVLVQPLLFFFLLINILITPEIFKGGFSTPAMILLISIAGLYCAFLAGWYCMFHKSIEYVEKLNLPPEEKAINSLNIFKEFFPGVGKYFYKVVLGMIIYFLFIFILSILIHIIGTFMIGIPENFFVSIMKKSFKSNAEVIAFMKSISPAEKIKLFKWNLLVVSLGGLFSYLTMFWVQAIIADNKNPFVAYLESIKTVFKNPIIAMAIHSSQWFGLTAIYAVMLAFSMNFIIQFIMLFVLILSVVYFTLMTFLYYERFR